MHWSPASVLLVALVAAASGCASPAMNEDPAPTSAATTETGAEEGVLRLKSIGFILDYYDPETGMAGDMRFTKDEVPYGKIWEDFGQDDPRFDDPSKRNPQPTFRLPLGTPVRSLVDGVVQKVEVLYSGDYTIFVGAGPEHALSYETEHVIHPLVKVGDWVSAGEVIAEVSTHDSQHYPGLGLLEIGILKGGDPPQHVCPFEYLDASIKDETEAKISALYAAWEDYRGEDVYDEAQFVSPGCVTLEPVDG